jgi:hypothetical protein
LRGKVSFNVKRALRAAMFENMPYLVHNLILFEHFPAFRDQNFSFLIKEI